MALEIINRVPEDPDVNPRALYVKAFVLYRLGRNEEAIHSYKAFFSKDKGNTNAWINFGISYRDAGKTDESIRCYEKAIRINTSKGDVSKSWRELGCAWKEKGDPAKALECTVKSVALNPTGPGYYNLACYHALIGNKSEALEALRAAIFRFDERWLKAAKEDPDFDSIRDSAEFRDLVS
jgi:tetratricopeptide (TPR) repeat protein